MNQESRTKDLQPIYPQYVNTYDQRDEISLVDLWIALLKFKKVYLWSFIFSILVGISAVTLLITPKYTMTTVLEIVTYKSNLIETPTAVMNRINTLFLPLELKAVAKANTGQSFETDISNPEGTSLIEIKNKISKSQVGAFNEFQSKVSARIINSHQDLMFELNSNLRKAIELEDVLRPETLTREVYIKKFKPEEWSNIKQLEDRIKKQTDSKGFNQSDADLKALERMVLIAQEVRGLINQKISLEQELATGFDLYRDKIKVSEKKVLEYKNNIQNGLTRIVSQSELSLKPVNLSKNTAYIFVILLSFLLAFTFTLVAMFRAKVIERISEEA